ncbi:MAG: ubiquinone biosynthesis protein UbiH [Alphaproteobacteria bacterium]|nr:ubiquinone biosynthesis protein UbiH [Alphaproteobacteria bacterium]
MDARDQTFDILVAGAGPAGLCAALALSQRGWRIALAGPQELQPSARTVALLENQLRFLDQLGVREQVEAAGERLAAMRIADATGALFSPPPVEFHASEIDLPAFGVNIENNRLIEILAGKIAQSPDIACYSEFVAAYQFEEQRVTAQLTSGARISCQLVVAADGAASPARKAAGIGVRQREYPQVAMTALLAHKVHHGNVSTEFHTREGAFTLVPLPDGEGEHRSSLVWMLRPQRRRQIETLDAKALAREIEQRAHYLLGEMRLLTKPAWFSMRSLQAIALTSSRLALAGEAAHVFPPVGAQGLNLGLRDAQQIAQAIDPAASVDPGDAALLKSYEKLRQGDVHSRTFGVNLLNSALLSSSPVTDLARSAGLGLLSTCGPLRRLAMREGIAPGFHTLKTDDAASRPM